ncbi:flagellin [Sulfitobacter sp. AS59]|uniref:flagellin n=1 Tax=Sulfitobacter sp. AS59 TaxID=3135784 RepID=UPI00319E7761
MKSMSIGDLAQSFVLRHRNSDLKQQMARLTQELTTGQVADVRHAVKGNYSYLTEVERSLDVLNGYKMVTAEASIFASNIQTTLGRYQEVGEQLANSLVVSSIGATSGGIGEEAKATVDTLVSVLNTRSAGRSIFGGTATDRSPTETSAVLLSELTTAMAGATNPADMFTAAEAWFNSPTGYDLAFYQGGSTALSDVRISGTEQVSFDIRATDPDLKKTLLFASVAAVADDPAFGLDEKQITEVYNRAGASLLGASDSLTSLRANVGVLEAQIDRTATRNAAEMSAMEYEKSALLQVDPYEAATKLEEVQFQLQSIYSVTVRMSKLSLANFL